MTVGQLLCEIIAQLGAGNIGHDDTVVVDLPDRKIADIPERWPVQGIFGTVDGLGIIEAFEEKP